MQQKADGPPIHRQRRRLYLAWTGLIGLSVWLAFRVWRGAVLTETGDFNHFYWAAEAMRQGRDIYAAGVRGYLYPPLIAWIMQPLASFGLVDAALAWGAVNAALTTSCLWLTLRLVSRALGGPRNAVTTGAVWLCAIALTLGPVRYELEHGQTDTIVLAGLCLGLWWLDARPTASGLAFGLAACVKYHVVLLLPYLLIRGRWRGALGMVAGLLLFSVLPAVQLGPATTLRYLHESYQYLVALFLGGAAPSGVNLHTLDWDMSISITSAFDRLFESAGMTAPAPPAFLASAAVAALVFGATWALYSSRGVRMFGAREDQDRDSVALLEWCGIIVAVLAFSPQTAMRHSFILLPVNLLAAYVVLVPRRGVVRWPLVVGIIGYQLAARLPPGGQPAFAEALRAWRSVSGATWFLLLMWFGLVWSTLSYAAAGRENEAPQTRPDREAPGLVRGTMLAAGSERAQRS